MKKPFTIELFFLSSLDLMIKVEYAKAANSLRYASHRKMKPDERVATEQYIMTEVAPKTDYYHKHHSTFAYLGTDKRLEKKLVNFHQKNESVLSGSKEKEVIASVNELINVSMRDYYGEKIGELIMSARNELKNGECYGAIPTNLSRQMSDLISAYNVYADTKITLDEIIPSELKPYWPGLEEARYNVTLPL